MKQPDFGAFFHQSEFRRIEWQIRFDGNMAHDIQYMTSYLNDARFDFKLIHVNRKRLIIPLTRDSWELGGFDHDRWGYVAGELGIYPIDDFCRDCIIELPLAWLQANQDDRRELTLRDVQISGTDNGQTRHCRLDFFAGAITVKLDTTKGDPRIVYRDTGALYSHHNNKLISEGIPHKKGKVLL